MSPTLAQLHCAACVYLSMDGPTTYGKFKICGFTKFVRAGNFKCADLRNLYVHVECEREIVS